MKKKLRIFLNNSVQYIHTTIDKENVSRPFGIVVNVITIHYVACYDLIHMRDIKMVRTIFLKECQGYTIAFLIAILTIGE